MKKTILALSIFLLLLPLVAFAQDWMNNFLINQPYLVNRDPVQLIFDIVRYVLGFLGVIAVIVIIIGGFMWMTAAGNEEKVAKAKKVLVQGIIGLAIVMLAFVIATFVINMIRRA